MPADVFKIETVFRAIDKMSGPVKHMQNNISRMIASTNRGIQTIARTTSRATDAMKRNSGAVMRYGAVGGAGLGFMLARGAEFERIMVGAAARVDDGIERNTKRFDKLARSVLDVSKASEFTATEVARMANEMIKGGEGADQLAKTLPQVIDFATATDINADIAGWAAPRMLAAFNLNAEDAAQRGENLNRVLSVMSRVANTSTTDITEMMFTVANSASVMAAAGQEIETTATLMHAFTQASIEGTRAATGLRRISFALAGIGKDSQDALRELGVSIADPITGELRDSLEVFDEVRDKFMALNQAEQFGMSEKLFSKIGLNAALEVLSIPSEKLHAYRNSLIGLRDEHTRLADMARQSVSIGFQKFISALEAVQAISFLQVSGDLKKLIDSWTAWVSENEVMLVHRLASGIKFIIDNIGTIGAVVGGIFVLTAAMIALNVTVQAVASSILVLIAAKNAWIWTSRVAGDIAAWFALRIELLSKVMKSNAVVSKLLRAAHLGLRRAMVLTSVASKSLAAKMLLPIAAIVKAIGAVTGLTLVITALKIKAAAFFTALSLWATPIIVGLKLAMAGLAKAILGVAVAILASPIAWLVGIVALLVAGVIKLTGGLDKFIERLDYIKENFSFEKLWLGMKAVTGFVDNEPVTDEEIMEIARRQQEYARRRQLATAENSSSARAEVVVRSDPNTQVAVESQRTTGTGASIVLPKTGEP